MGNQSSISVNGPIYEGLRRYKQDDRSSYQQRALELEIAVSPLFWSLKYGSKSEMKQRSLILNPLSSFQTRLSFFFRSKNASGSTRPCSIPYLQNVTSQPFSSSHWWGEVKGCDVTFWRYFHAARTCRGIHCSRITCDWNEGSYAAICSAKRD